MNAPATAARILADRIAAWLRALIAEQQVYFPVVYDGSEWLGSAPRDPERRGQEHVGRW